MALELTDEDKDSILWSLRRVGPEKIIGYLPLHTVRDILELRLEELEAEGKLRGLATVRLEPDQCCIKSGALYVYYRQPLGALLKAPSTMLHAADWPLNPDTFVRRIAAEWLEPSDPIMLVIDEAFGNALSQPIHDENTSSTGSG